MLRRLAIILDLFIDQILKLLLRGRGDGVGFKTDWDEIPSSKLHTKPYVWELNTTSTHLWLAAFHLPVCCALPL